MGLLDAIGTGLTEAAPVAARTAESYVQAQIDEAKQERLMEMKRKMTKDDAAEERARVAGIVNAVPTTKTVEVADESGGHGMLRDMTAHERDRATASALEKAGDINTAKSYLERAERGEDREHLRTTQAAKQKSDDEKWRATFAETKRFHDETLKRQSQQLGLKQQEAKEFEKTVDSYMTNKAQYEMLRAEKGNDPDLIAAAKQGMESDALKLKQYRVDVGDTSDFAKRLNLSATLTSLNKTIDDINADPVTVAKAKVARNSVIEQMASLTSGKDEGGDTEFELVDGKLVKTGSTKPAVTARGTKQAAAGGIINERPVPVISADYDNVERARTERKAKAERESEARMEAQRKRDVEREEFNRRVSTAR